MIQEIQTANDLSLLWASLLPESELPSIQVFIRWAGMTDDVNILSHAIKRTARRFHKSLLAEKVELTQDQLERYVTGVIVHERTERNNNQKVLANQ